MTLSWLITTTLQTTPPHHSVLSNSPYDTHTGDLLTITAKGSYDINIEDLNRSILKGLLPVYNIASP